jgi:hypothetical protein
VRLAQLALIFAVLYVGLQSHQPATAAGPAKQQAGQTAGSDNDFDPVAYLASKKTSGRGLTDKEIGLGPWGDYASPRPAPVDARSVPNWDDLPDTDLFFHKWRFDVLDWMRVAEHFFAGIAFAFIAVLIFLACTDTGKRLLQRLNLKNWETITEDEWKPYRMLSAVLLAFIGGWISIRGALNPNSADSAQLLANLEAHPVASILGALLPSIVLAPFFYWLFGLNRLRTKNHKLKNGVRFVKEFLANQHAPSLFIFAGMILSTAGFLLLDFWVPRLGFWGNLMIGRSFGIPFRYILLSSLILISLGLYRYRAIRDRPTSV